MRAQLVAFAVAVLLSLGNSQLAAREIGYPQQAPCFTIQRAGPAELNQKHKGVLLGVVDSIARIEEE